MNTSSLTRLGGLAVILAQFLLILNNLLYLLSGQQPPDATRVWISLFGFAFFVLGVMALYASQSQQSGVAGLIGFVLLIFSYIGDVAVMTMYLAAAEGIGTIDQIAQVQAFETAHTVINWLAWLGVVIFGYGTYRAGIYPKIAAVLLMLVAPVSFLTGFLDFMIPVFIILSFATWVWLGWKMLVRNGVAQLRPMPAA